MFGILRCCSPVLFEKIIQRYRLQGKLQPFRAFLAPGIVEFVIEDVFVPQTNEETAMDGKVSFNMILVPRCKRCCIRWKRVEAITPPPQRTQNVIQVGQGWPAGSPTHTACLWALVPPIGVASCNRPAGHWPEIRKTAIAS